VALTFRFVFVPTFFRAGCCFAHFLVIIGNVKSSVSPPHFVRRKRHRNGSVRERSIPEGERPAGSPEPRATGDMKIASDFRDEFLSGIRPRRREIVRVEGPGAEAPLCRLFRGWSRANLTGPDKNLAKGASISIPRGRATACHAVALSTHCVRSSLPPRGGRWAGMAFMASLRGIGSSHMGTGEPISANLILPREPIRHSEAETIRPTWP